MFAVISFLCILAVTSSAKEIICPPEGVKYFPHPTEWGRFVGCNNGVQTDVDCPNGLHFNSEGLFCYDSDDIIKSGKRKVHERRSRCPDHPLCHDYPRFPVPPVQPIYSSNRCSGPSCSQYPSQPLYPQGCPGNSWCPEKPTCPGHPSCPTVPICPGHPSCPVAPICPGHPSCPVAPICPGHPSCPVTPVCPGHPSCPETPVCPGHPSCPPVSTCPDHPWCQEVPICPGHPTCPNYPTSPVYPDPCPGDPSCPGITLPYPDYSHCPGFPGYPGYGHPVGTCPFCNDACRVHFLQDANDCTVFYMCNWGRPIWMRCPAGLHFNIREQVCDYPWRAGCAHTGQPPCS